MSEWTPERKEQAIELILEGIATSEVGLDHICGANEELPNPSTFYRWMEDDEKLRERYARARERQQHFCIDNATVLATQLVAKTPTHTIDPAAFRAYWDAMKWRASKLAPKTYGDKQDITSDGKAIKGGVIVVANEADKELLESL
jgi:transposase-like protein